MGWLRRDVYGGSLGDTWVTFLRRRTFPRSERTSVCVSLSVCEDAGKPPPISPPSVCFKLLQKSLHILLQKKSSPISTPYFTIVFTKKSSYSISSYYGIVLCSDSSMTISVNNSSHRVGIIPHQTNISPLYCYFANTWKVFAHNFKWNSDPPLNLKERRWWQRCSQHGTLLLSTTSTPPRS